MPFDGGVIVGYLAAAMGKQVADRAINALLNRLAALVSQWLGYASLNDLGRRPDDPRVRARVDRAIRSAAAADAEFAYDLSRAQEELDRRGARYLIGDIYAPHGQVAVGHSPIAIGQIYAPYRHPGDIRDAPGWAKGLVVIGSLLCVASIGLFGYTMFTNQPQLGDPDFGSFPEGIKTAGAIFFVGFVLAAIGSMVAGLSKDRS
jgi:hypothetical protein